MFCMARIVCHLKFEAIATQSTETRKRKGVELVILLSYQSQHVRISKANTSCHSARHLKHF